MENKASKLIPLLQEVQEKHGYIPREAIDELAAKCAVSPAEVYGVVTFYRQFRLTPRGRFVVKVCNGTACHVNGSAILESAASDALGIERGQTDARGLFTLESVNCVGCCSLAPVVMVNDDTHGSLDQRRLRTLLGKLRRSASEPGKEPQA
jgi:NADH-quinone oxidoreductase subunit E